MNDIIRKLTSRKFLLALVGVVSGLALAFGVEGSEIVEIVRGMSVSLTDLPVLLQTIKSGGTLGQNVPKSADKEDSVCWN